MGGPTFCLPPRPNIWSLPGCTDVDLDPDRILGLLRDSAIRWQVRYEPMCGSTQDLARQAARDGVVAGCVVATDFQHAGRGRHGAAWTAPRGDALLFSVVLRPPPGLLPLAPLRAGIGLVQGIREATGVLGDLKWPNDVHVEGLKLAGILIEHPPSDALVIGIGLNVNQEPTALAGLPATSLRVILGRRLERAPLLARILLALEDWFSPSRSDAEVLDAWRARSTMLGRRIRYRGPDGTGEGIAEAILEDGSLRVRLPDGRPHVLVAAEVTSVRPDQS